MNSFPSEFPLRTVISHLCDEFINTTNIVKLNKSSDCGIEATILSVINKLLDQLNVKDKVSVISTSTKNYFFSCSMYHIINFFSSCYEDVTRSIKLIKFQNAINGSCLYAIEHMICLYIFISLNDILMIDETRIVIPEYKDVRCNLIPHRTYNDIVDEFYNKVYEKYINSSSVIAPSIVNDMYKSLNPDHLLLEIKNKIKENRSKYKFIINLFYYKQFSYFANSNNPRKGMFTYLRFL